MAKTLSNTHVKNGYRIDEFVETDEHGKVVSEYSLVYDPDGNFLGEFDTWGEVDAAIGSNPSHGI